MKKKFLLAAILLVILFPVVVAQTEEEKKTIEQEIRKLDKEHAAAVLSGDLATMDKYWTEDFIVTNPFNEIDRANRIRNASLQYASFIREAEVVKVHGNTVIVMGKETVVPKEGSVDAGKTIYRRYTNVWMKRDGQWRLIARHANVICNK